MLAIVIGVIFVIWLIGALITLAWTVKEMVSYPEEDLNFSVSRTEPQMLLDWIGVFLVVVFWFIAMPFMMGGSNEEG